METRACIVVLLVLLGASFVGAEKVYAPIEVFSNDGTVEVASGGYTTKFNCSSRYDTEFFVPVEANLDEMCQSRMVSCQEQLGYANNRLIEQQNKTLMLEDEKRKDSWLSDFNRLQMILLSMVWVLAIGLILAAVVVLRSTGRHTKKQTKLSKVEVYGDGGAGNSGESEATGN